MALNHPEAVAALVLMDTYVGPEPEETRTRYFGMMDMVEKAGAIPPPIQEAIVPLFFSSVTIQKKPDLVNRFKSALASIPAERVPSVLTIGRAIFSRRSVLERLGEIRVPTLVIVGDEDRSRPPHEAEKMAQAIPGARLEVIPEAGHISNLEQPERVTALLEAFLAEALQ
ncbi:MAG: alpha/beta fold hydrolase [Chloroflexi bacterium]|nr:MAG: alpha/beta fold hydrolase [Chloroflexota bacterium]